MRALITAGGTRELIDDVRVLTNLSTGRFGCAIAEATLAAGMETTILGGATVMARRRELSEGIALRPFEGFSSLRQELERAIDDLRPDLVFMAAAVSDYSPARHAGKMPSSADRITIHLERNPKLLASLRDRCGPEAVIVGFKLLSAVAPATLLQVARDQSRRCRLDMTVANDLAELGGPEHPVSLVLPDGRSRRCRGARAEVAAAVVAAARQLRDPDAGPDLLTQLGAEPAALEAAILDVALAAEARPFDCLAPIDSAASAGFVIADLARQSWERGELRGAYELGDGRLLLIGAGARTAENGDILAFQGGAWRRIGVLERGQGGVAPELDEGLSWGTRDAVMAALELRGAPILRRGLPTIEWIARGYRDDPAAPALLPPQARADLRLAGSVCLIDARQRRVLIGRRKTPPWKGYWAFPGGSAEGAESAEEAARREFEEETSIAPPPYAPIGTTRVFVAAGAGGEKAYEVTNYQILSIGQPEPRESDEMAAEWVAIEDSLSLEPTAAGTRRILWDIARRLGVTPG